MKINRREMIERLHLTKGEKVRFRNGTSFAERVCYIDEYGREWVFFNNDLHPLERRKHYNEIGFGRNFWRSVVLGK